MAVTALVPRPQRPGLGALAFRLACLAVLGVAVVGRNSGWEWAATAVLALVAIVHRGMGVTFRDRFERMPELTPTAADQAPPRRVAILIPVRNEAEGIEATVRALPLSTDDACEVLVMNDGSTDDTAAILGRLSSEMRGLQVGVAPARPPGWIGKSHALTVARQQVGPGAEWLLFLDARTVLAPGVVRDAVAFAEAHGVDILGGIPQFHGPTPVEQWASMLATHSIVQNVWPEKLNDPAVPPVGIFGAFILVRSALYDRSGGHAAAPGDYFDDLALAHAVRMAGGRLGVVRAGGRISMRRYHGLADLCPRMIRSFRFSAGNSAACLVSELAITGLLYVAPAVVFAAALAAAVTSRGGSAATFAMGAGALTAYLAAAWSLGSAAEMCAVSAVSRWTFPVGAGLMVGLRGIALIEVLRGRPATWRGRPVVG